MNSKSGSIAFKLLLILALLTGGGLVLARGGFNLTPCSKPIQYSIGSFDSKFKLSQQDFISSIAEAEKIWETTIDKNLFQYSPSGVLKINLVYDYRQEATDKLVNLGFKIENTQSSYENLKSQYDARMNSYNQKKLSLESQVSQFDARKKTYEQQVEYWNSKGGAPKRTVATLNAEHDSLEKLADQINTSKDAINELVADINALASVLNSLATQLNLNVSNYNTIGESRGKEFEEGVYVKDGKDVQINIFEFSSKDQLVRLLAHELGHALGLEHVDDPQAIMYRLNQGENDTTTAADLAELKKNCKIN